MPIPAMKNGTTIWHPMLMCVSTECVVDSTMQCSVALDAEVFFTAISGNGKSSASEAGSTSVSVSAKGNSFSSWGPSSPLSSGKQETGWYCFVQFSDKIFLGLIWLCDYGYVKKVFFMCLCLCWTFLLLSTNDMKAFHKNGVQKNKNMASHGAFVQYHLCTIITDFLVSYQM